MFFKKIVSVEYEKVHITDNIFVRISSLGAVSAICLDNDFCHAWSPHIGVKSHIAGNRDPCYGSHQ